jgi:hypothetical protein
MKERKIAAGAVVLLIVGGLAISRNTDAIFVGAGVLFFVVCIAYAEWCERL